MTMETKDELRQRVIDLLKDNVDDPSLLDECGLDDDLSSLGINSLTFIKLVIATEMEFGVSWSDEDLDFRNFSTINQIMNYISLNQGEQ
ncbi:acyl carrier protein [Paenibacillus aquistagni]|uniref:Acyl carrier protein n=1 Tax=Paenibacillus aquistagni TaxID=1852522 RepID=A0A1X7LWK8_9BACL|nr:phosphopantetheine-binding protein [Paenibacillus aquistagni]SMG57683.1 acyl carrier protein [Paenibacillus aquistagni]